jgi:hypothetical protein
MPELVIIADDLTGTLYAAVRFSKRGISAEISLDADYPVERMRSIRSGCRYGDAPPPPRKGGKNRV